jgi:hypothetical protein
MKLGTLAAISALLLAGLGVLGDLPAKTETTDSESVYDALAKAPEKYRVFLQKGMALMARMQL